MIKFDKLNVSTKTCSSKILIILTIIASFGGLLFGYDTGSHLLLLSSLCYHSLLLLSSSTTIIIISFS